MPLIPPPSGLMSSGLVRLFRGLREGDQRMLYAGAAMLAYGWLRKTAPPKKELLYRRQVPVGSTVVVRYRKGDEPRLEIHEPEVI